MFIAESDRDGLVETNSYWLRSLPLDHQAVVRDVRGIISPPPLFGYKIRRFNDWQPTTESETAYLTTRLLREFDTHVSPAWTFGAKDKVQRPYNV